MDLDKIAAKVVEAGGGISDSSLYGKLKRALLSSIRDIERNFINVKLNYSNREVNGTVDGHTVQFFFSILRASNGEVFGLPVLTVDGKKRDRFYGKISDELAKALKETGGKAASVKVAKINQRDYKFCEASIKKGGVMNRKMVANELVKIARELVGAGELYYTSNEGFVKLTLWKHDGKESYLVSLMDRSALIPADKDTKFKGTDWSIPADRLDEKARQEGWKPTTLAQIKHSISRKSPF